MNTSITTTSATAVEFFRTINRTALSYYDNGANNISYEYSVVSDTIESSIRKSVTTYKDFEGIWDTFMCIFKTRPSAKLTCELIDGQTSLTVIECTHPSYK